MSRPRLAMLAAGMALAGCDRIAEQWPLKAPASSVTVKLPPPKTASPGFAFNDRRKAPPTEIH